MGLTIDRERFSDDDFRHFRERLARCLDALEALLQRPGFGAGPRTVGAELELALVDGDAQPALINDAVARAADESKLQLELDRFNLEINLNYYPLASAPFTALANECSQSLERVSTAAHGHGARVASIGILPTLRLEEMTNETITDAPRYRVLARAIERQRGEPFVIHINGQDPLRTTASSISLEGANTSFQLHLRVEPNEFPSVFNAAQVATPLAVAIGANSPTLFGHVLWDETRVALFKQSVDSRMNALRRHKPTPSRVGFGNGWVRDSALEVFAEAAALYPPLLPVCGDEDPLAVARDGGVPALNELRLHHGSIWQWNRAVYDPADGGHLRVELRALPSGPTPLDMVANAAFLIGMTLGLAPRMKRMLPAYPFRTAEYNFYRAAQSGLEAVLLWPAAGNGGLEETPVTDLLSELLPVAEQGLSDAGVATTEIERMLGIIRARLHERTSGARWQKQMLSGLCRLHDRDTALRLMLEAYLERAATGRPVHEWEHRV